MAIYKNPNPGDPPSFLKTLGLGGAYSGAYKIYNGLFGEVKRRRSSSYPNSVPKTQNNVSMATQMPEKHVAPSKVKTPGSAYKSKYSYKSDVIFAPFDSQKNLYKKMSYVDGKLTSSDEFYPAGYRPSLRGGKMSLYNEKDGQYYDIDENGNPVKSTPTTSQVSATSAGNNQRVPGIQPMETLGLEELLPQPPDKLPGGTPIPANDMFATIDALSEADKELLKKQKRMTTAQQIAGTVAELPWLMASLNGRAPDMIQPPTQYAPNLNYSNPIYEQGVRDNKAVLFGARNYLSQHGMQELSPGMLADYYTAKNQMDAQEAQARNTFANENATNIANAQTANELNLYNARRDYAATIDALNAKREQVSSTIMSQMLANYFGGENKKLAIEAAGNKNNAIYLQLKKYIQDGDMAKFNLLMSSITGSPEMKYGSEPIETATEWDKLVN
jgi:hypothetical protein